MGEYIKSEAIRRGTDMKLVGKQVQNEVLNNLGSLVWDQVWDQVWERVEAQERNFVWEKLLRTVERQATDQGGLLIGRQVKQQVEG